MTEIETVVKNSAGIHCRPSSEILLKRQEFPDCLISIETDNGNTDLDSILALIGLGLAQGDRVKVKADGPGEEEACRVIAGLFSYQFEFPPKE